MTYRRIYVFDVT